MLPLIWDSLLSKVSGLDFPPVPYSTITMSGTDNRVFPNSSILGFFRWILHIPSKECEAELQFHNIVNVVTLKQHFSIIKGIFETYIPTTTVHSKSELSVWLKSRSPWPTYTFCALHVKAYARNTRQTDRFLYIDLNSATDMENI